MKAYFRVFVNFEQNNWAQLFLMMKFVYNNAQNASTGHRLFEFNCGYCFYVFYKEDLDFCSKSRIVEELSFMF